MNDGKSTYECDCGSIKHMTPCLSYVPVTRTALAVKYITAHPAHLVDRKEGSFYVYK